LLFTLTAATEFEVKENPAIFAQVAGMSFVLGSLCFFPGMGKSEKES
jgi:hypothetical protein